MRNSIQWKKGAYLLALVGALIYLGITQPWHKFSSHARELAVSAQSYNTDKLLNEAFENRLNNIQVEGEGKVIKTLPEDTKGSRHQLFLLQLKSGHTLLLSHNISLAPRIETIKEGDAVRFFGEYKWNEKGGVIHWTHHDPRHKHIAGWVSHDGKLYQ